jgi:large subunit ribosomal protein L3
MASAASALLGRKIGMTRYYDADGVSLPVTVVEAGPCVVTQVKTTATDGYSAIQIAFDDVKPRRSTMPVIGHDAKAGTAPKRMHRELRLETDAEAEAFEVGQTITVEAFGDVKFVDVTGTSKGKGFQGPMKLHNFSGLEASHGVERKHRSAGSIASHASNAGTGPKLKKGKRMAAHMGAERVTVRNLDVVGVDPARNLLLLKGPVPGPNRGYLFMRSSKRLGRRKQNIASA